MKEFRKVIECYAGEMEQQWKTLPGYRRRRIIKIIFAMYLLLSIFSILHIGLNLAGRNSTIPIEHIRSLRIENRIKNQETLIQEKNSHHERFK